MDTDKSETVIFYTKEDAQCGVKVNSEVTEAVPNDNSEDNVNISTEDKEISEHAEVSSVLTQLLRKPSEDVDKQTEEIVSNQEEILDPPRTDEILDTPGLLIIAHFIYNLHYVFDYV